MTFEEIKLKLDNSKYEIKEIKDISFGKQIKLTNGGCINYYNNGNFNVQGKNTEEIREFIEQKKEIKNKKIFVVYGRDDMAKLQLEALLRRWDLEPIILDQQVSAGKTIIEKLEELSSDVGYAIVLATPDDEGRLRETNDFKYRVRQNVTLELGMFLAKLGREKVAILLKEAENFEKPSDIEGLIYMPYQNKIEDISLNLIRELTRQGYSIDTSRL